MLYLSTKLIEASSGKELKQFERKGIETKLLQKSSQELEVFRESSKSSKATVFLGLVSISTSIKLNKIEMDLVATETDTIFTFDAASEAIKNLFTQDTADFRFHIINSDGGCDVIAVHKRLLAALSTVFGAMFSGNWNESTSVKLIDTSADAFNTFLEYFYCNRIKVNEGNVGEILYLACKYKISAIKATCATYIMEHLSLTNVLDAINLATTFELAALTKKCRAMIGANIKEIIASADFADCHWRVLYEILDGEAISCTEEELFDAAITWASVECTKQGLDVLSGKNLRSVLGNAYNLFRFEQMERGNFAKRLKIHKDMFSRDEVVSIIHTRDRWQQGSRNDCRQRKQFRFVFQHLKDASETRTSASNPFKLCFRSSNLVMLKSFGLSNSYVASLSENKTDFFIGTIQVQKIDGDGECDGKKYNFKRAFAPSANAVSCLQLLDEPVIIEPNHTYAFCVQTCLRRVETLYVFEANKQDVDGIIFSPHQDGQPVSKCESVIAQLCFEYCDGENMRKLIPAKATV